MFVHTNIGAPTVGHADIERPSLLEGLHLNLLTEDGIGQPTKHVQLCNSLALFLKKKL